MFDARVKKKSETETFVESKAIIVTITIVIKR